MNPSPPVSGDLPGDGAAAPPARRSQRLASQQQGDPEVSTGTPPLQQNDQQATAQPPSPMASASAAAQPGTTPALDLNALINALNRAAQLDVPSRPSVPLVTAQRHSSSTDTRGIGFPSFAGSIDDDPRQWLFQAEELLNYIDVDPDRRVVRAAMALTADARYWYEDAVREFGYFASWEYFKTKFNQRFRSEERESRLRTALRTMTFHGNMAGYISAFQKLSCQLSPSAMVLADRIDNFLDPLPPSTQIHIRAQHPKSMEELYQLVIDYDAIVRRTRRSATRDFQPESTPNSATAIPTNVNQRSRSNRFIGKRYTRVESASPRIFGSSNSQQSFNTIEDRTCYKCGEKGHISPNCPQNKEAMKPHNRPTKPTPKPSFNMLYTDTPEGDNMLQSNSTDECLPILEGLVDGHPCRLLLDSGASSNYVSNAYAEKHNLLVTSMKEREVRAADGIRLSTSGIVTCELKLDDAIFNLTAYTFPFDRFDVVLGLSFLRQYNPIIDWKETTLEIRVDDTTHVIKGKQQDSMLTSFTTEAIQVRNIDSGTLTPLLQHSIASEANEVLEAGRRLFPALFQADISYPPARQWDHVIDTEVLH